MPRAKMQTLSELRVLQRMTAGALFRPLVKDDALDPVWIDGRDMHAVADEFIKSSARLSAFERLEIYSRSYWFRLLECLYDDYPGLRAVLGEERFMTLARAYLAECPSRSFTLRNLGSRLHGFLLEHPELSAPRTELAIDMSLMEWAQIVAFDGPAKKPISEGDLLGADPATLRLALQPYLTLLKLEYPLDEFLLGMKRDRSRGEASNAIDSAPKQRRQRELKLPRRRVTHLAIHRCDNSVYYKRLAPEAFALLAAMQDGRPLAQACEIAFASTRVAKNADATKTRRRKATVPIDDPASLIRTWFETWTGLGWFCKA
jgi:hypothetical protein